MRGFRLGRRGFSCMGEGGTTCWELKQDEINFDSWVEQRFESLTLDDLRECATHLLESNPDDIEASFVDGLVHSKPSQKRTKTEPSPK
ncbi:hypothetical protein DPMN_120508 [Dreissena polymorpha]|uniref:Uncharacterized protein n=1 Tax=Dreissena polymorpha TaxID=45954 RepID=A0A9D4JSR6_DREPO|nr:hypothetical protein DPMN_120508 [Dreissena polymorpha]